ncbi:MAG: serine--tRNA ligase [Chlamydiales bacterium]
MLDIKFIKKNRELVEKAIDQKRIKLSLDELLKSESELHIYKQKFEGLQAERNSNAKLISQSPVEKKADLIRRGKEISLEINTLKPKLHTAEQQLREYLLLVPNIPDEKAPIGINESDNVEVRKWGKIPKFSFPVLDHVEILRKHNWGELDRITKISGNRTYALRNEMVTLEMLFLQIALQKARANGFTTLSLPSIARESALYGTGHFPEGRDQVYHLADENFYLTGTSEVIINSLHADEILQEKDLPLLYAGFSPCFRREAGSAGRDVRGLVRVHQFYKVELFVICKNDPMESEHWLSKLLSISQELMQALELPYRVMDCCTGDMGLGKVRMFDIEAWVPSQGKYRETHSCSMLYDWQARRTGLRYRSIDTGDIKFCHTLNNTAIATPRIIVPFLENHQLENGSISLPKILQPYFAGISRLGDPDIYFI